MKKMIYIFALSIGVCLSQSSTCFSGMPCYAVRNNVERFVIEPYRIAYRTTDPNCAGTQVTSSSGGYVGYSYITYMVKKSANSWQLLSQITGVFTPEHAKAEFMRLRRDFNNLPLLEATLEH